MLVLRWMAVITERLDGGGGVVVADGEAEKRERKNKKYRRTKSHDGRGWNKSDERKKNGLWKSVSSCACLTTNTPLCYLSPLGCDYRSGSVLAPADTTLQLRNKQAQRASLQLPLYPEDDTIFKSSTLSADIYIIALENCDFTPSLMSIKAAQMDKSRKMKPSSDTEKNNSNICLRRLLQTRFKSVV